MNPRYHVKKLCRFCASKYGGIDMDIDPKDFWLGVCDHCHQETQVTDPAEFKFDYPQRKAKLVWPERERYAR